MDWPCFCRFIGGFERAKSVQGFQGSTPFLLQPEPENSLQIFRVQLSGLGFWLGYAIALRSIPGIIIISVSVALFDAVQDHAEQILLSKFEGRFFSQFIVRCSRAYDKQHTI